MRISEKSESPTSSLAWHLENFARLRGKIRLQHAPDLPQITL
ncbi:hypothetical protein HMPREF0201_03480 [Cedecea davisae DSM 4568]|uniref:Uncharacterized protein n=1 Tax=Cedecea davisae DSM 4568 TaxID=566551 RepID=S3JPU8_9ENTR|nr:hypothetical protein HMPREF0201_03480 [Cedecea davisae DSM 4568]